MPTMTECYEDGRLSAAIEAASAAVRAAPADRHARWQLGELLLLAGEFERADRQFDTLGSLDATSAPRVALMRHMIRAAVQRADFHACRGVPGFVGDGPTTHQKLLVSAHVHLHAGDTLAAKAIATEAGRLRQRIAGIHGDCQFSDFHDADPLLAGIYEVYLAGAYLWVAAEQVLALDFQAPSRLLDLFVRTAKMTLRAGEAVVDQHVHMPVSYATLTDTDDLCRLARSTKWIGEPRSVARGVGQRMFTLSDGDDLDLLDLTTVSFCLPAAASS